MVSPTVKLFILVLIASSALAKKKVVQNTVPEGVKILNYVQNPGFEDAINVEDETHWQFGTGGQIVQSDECRSGLRCVELQTLSMVATGEAYASVYGLTHIMQFEVPQKLVFSLWYKVTNTVPWSVFPYMSTFAEYQIDLKAPGDAHVINIPALETTEEWQYVEIEWQPTHLVRILKPNFNIYGAGGRVLVDDINIHPIYNEAHGANSVILEGDLTSFPAQLTSTMLIRAKDTIGASLYEGGAVATASLTRAKDNAVLPLTVVDNADGTYTVNLIAQVPGDHKLTVTLNNSPVVDAREVDFYLMPGLDLVSNAGWTGSATNMDAPVCVAVADGAGLLSLTVAAESSTENGPSGLPTGSCALVQSVPVHQAGVMPMTLSADVSTGGVTGDGSELGLSYTVHFADGTDSGPLLLAAAPGLAGQFLSAQLQYNKVIDSVYIEVVMNGGYVGIASFSTVVLVAKHAVASPSNSYFSGSGVWAATQGKTTGFDVYARGMFGNEIRGGVNPNDQLVVEVTRRIFGGEQVVMSAAVTADPNESVYHVQYTPTHHGTHMISVKLNGQHVGTSPVSLYVIPQTPSHKDEFLKNPTFGLGATANWNAVGSGYTLEETFACRTPPCAKVTGPLTSAGASQSVTLPDIDKVVKGRVRMSGWVRILGLPAEGEAQPSLIGLSMDITRVDGSVISDIYTAVDMSELERWQYVEVVGMGGAQDIESVTAKAVVNGGAAGLSVLFDDLSLHVASPELSIAHSVMHSLTSRAVVGRMATVDAHTRDETGIPTGVTDADLADLEVGVDMIEGTCVDNIGPIPFAAVAGGDGSYISIRFTPAHVGKYAVYARSKTTKEHMQDSPFIIEATRGNVLGMKVAVFSGKFQGDTTLKRLATSTDFSADFVTEILAGMEIPFDVFSISDLNAAGELPQLVDENGAGKYYATIFTQYGLVYGDDSSGKMEWVKAMTPEVEAHIAAYEANNAVRRIVLGSHPWAKAADVNAAPPLGYTEAFSVMPTADFLEWAGHLKSGAVMQVDRSYYTGGIPRSCAATWPVCESDTTKVLAHDEFGNAAAVVTRQRDGREELHAFWAFGRFMEAAVGVLPGLITWATRGMFVGRRRIHLSMQIDDHLLATWCWNPEEHTNEYPHGRPYRATNSDLDEHITWQNWLRDEYLPAGSDVKLELAINGFGGTYDDNKPPSQRVTEGTRDRLDHFYIESHTFTHWSLNEPRGYDDCYQDLKQNKDFLKERVCPYDVKDHCSFQSMVTPMITGLFNGNALKAMRDVGIDGVVGDNTIASLMNQKSLFNGVTSTVEEHGFAGQYYVPRFATNIYYHCKNEEENIDALKTAMPPHAFQFDTWEGKTLWDVLQAEAKFVFSYLASYQHDPYMFHQANLHYFEWLNNVDYPENPRYERHSLTTLWAKAVLDKLQKFNALPVITWTHDEFVRQYKAREEREACGLDGQLIVGDDGRVEIVRIHAENSCEAVVTGVKPVAYDISSRKTPRWREETYGPDLNLWLDMAAAGSLNVPLETPAMWGRVELAKPDTTPPSELATAAGFDVLFAYDGPEQEKSNDSATGKSASDEEVGVVLFGRGARAHALTMSLAVLSALLIQISLYFCLRATYKSGKLVLKSADDCKPHKTSRAPAERVHLTEDTHVDVSRAVENIFANIYGAARQESVDAKNPLEAIAKTLSNLSNRRLSSLTVDPETMERSLPQISMEEQQRSLTDAPQENHYFDMMPSGRVRRGSLD